MQTICGRNREFQVCRFLGKFLVAGVHAELRIGHLNKVGTLRPDGTRKNHRYATQTHNEIASAVHKINPRDGKSNENTSHLIVRRGAVSTSHFTATRRFVFLSIYNKVCIAS